MERIFRVALAGNPNCGKTTIFNQLTGTHQHVGNYSGVTVERKTGECHIGDEHFSIIDLPGIYSLSSASAEEKVAFSELMHNDIDLILNIIDAGNIRRNLYLTTQLAELGIPMLLVFNMADDAKKRGLDIDYAMLGRYFNSPFVTAVGSQGKGMDDIRNQMVKITSAQEKQIPKTLDYGPVVTAAVNDIVSMLEVLPVKAKRHIPLRCIAVKLLENDTEICADPGVVSILEKVDEWRGKISRRHGISGEIFMTDWRYGMIAGAVRESIKVNEEMRRQLSDEIDKVAASSYFGLPVFFLLMLLVFFLTFTCSEPFTDLLGWLFGKMADLINGLWPEGKLDFLRMLITDGIIGGVGGVLMFLPNILFLFLGIAFLEGTGYMARAAFVMDGFMHKFGLHGKSFIPMLLGFGCTVPAIMATRTIESQKDRLTTILVLPLMSCGARLPIYSLLIPAFFPAKFQAAVLWLIYIIGILLAFSCAALLKNTLFKGDDDVFVMELPPYRMPSARSLLLYMYERALLYLKKAGTFILGAAVIMFICNTLPCPWEDHSELEKYPAMTAKVQNDTTLAKEVKEEKLASIAAEEKAAKLKLSISGWVGRKLAVVLKPIGFDWKISASLIGAFAGKELFVSQLGILNSIGDTEGGGAGKLQESLKRQYTPLQAFCMMLFCLISMPCMATVAMVRRETDSWKLTFFQLIMLTGIAYVLTLLVYQIGSVLLR